MLVDSHCHLDFPELSENITQTLDLMKINQVLCALCVSVNLEKFPDVLALAEKYSCLYASVGVHPDATNNQEPSVADLLKLADHPRVIAIGETGLDYYWHKEAPEWQKNRFRTHIQAALSAKKPLIVHNRDAGADTIRILKEEHAEKVGGIMHCFVDTWEIAEQALALGFYISLSGIVTFKNAKSIQEIAKRIPLNRLLLETDSPYLAPVPFRGKTNQPAYLKYIAEEVARLRNISFSEIKSASTNNFFTLFNLACNQDENIKNIQYSDELKKENNNLC